MEILREAVNPWGQNIFVGIGWSLMWLALVGGIGFIVVHAIWAKLVGSKAAHEPPADGTGVPERIGRHRLSARVFHWGMASTMLVLLVTAFGPVMGWQFAWVSIHWIAGVLLIGTIVYHSIYAVFWQDFWSMWIGKDDMTNLSITFKHVMGKTDVPMPKSAKYPTDHKLYHHAAALAGLGAIATGILMLFRIDTMFWQRNQYILSDSTWGFVYVVHGLSGVALITLVTAHIYFAVRPDRWWITRSMFKGSITKEAYLEHHDPAKWAGEGRLPEKKVPAHTEQKQQDQSVAQA